jgi:hypothetical protein
MLNKYFLSLRKQTIPTVCGVYATAFAAEAKANMRNVGREEVDIDSLIYNWNAIDGVIDKVPNGFLLSDLNDNDIPDSFEQMAKIRFWCKDYSLRIYNLQKIEVDVNSLKRVIDNMERELMNNYKMTKDEIDDIYNNMISYNGDSFANYIDTIGSDFNSKSICLCFTFLL